MLSRLSRLSQEPVVGTRGDRGPAQRVRADDADRAGGRPTATPDHVRSGALPRSVDAQEGVEPALLHVEGEVTHSGDVSLGDRQTVDVDDRRGGHATPSVLALEVRSGCRVRSGAVPRGSSRSGSRCVGEMSRDRGRCLRLHRAHGAARGRSCRWPSPNAAPSSEVSDPDGTHAPEGRPGLKSRSCSLGHGPAQPGPGGARGGADGKTALGNCPDSG